MALTDDKQRTPVTDLDAVTTVERCETDEPSVVSDRAVEATVGVAVDQPTIGVTRVAEPVRQHRRFDRLTVAYGLVLLVASVTMGVTVGTADSVVDAGSPYAPPPAVFVQTD